MGPKIFTVREANALIPELEAFFSKVDKIRADMRRVKSKLDVLEMLWGERVNTKDNPDRREYAFYTEEIEKLKKLYENEVKALAEKEVFLKALDDGLIDFYGVVDGRLVFLCWKRGEKSIEYWHHLEGGYTGRQPLNIEDGVA